MCFVQSGYLLGDLTVLLGIHINVVNFICSGRGFRKHLQCVFSTVQYGSEKVARNIFALVSGKENRTKALWGARFLLLLKKSAQNGIDPACFVLIQFMERMEP